MKFFLFLLQKKMPKTQRKHSRKASFSLNANVSTCLKQLEQVIKIHFPYETITPQRFTIGCDKATIKEHYDKYGYVIINVQECYGDWFDSAASKHISMIDDYLKYFSVGKQNFVPEIQSLRKIPAKLNLGIISGTPFYDSTNQSTNDLKYQIDDYINQSETAWALRYMCKHAYKMVLDEQHQSDELLSSIEESTVMLLESSSNFKIIQSDKLHYLPKIVSQETDEFGDMYWPRGFLSLNEGSSFSFIPFYHWIHETLKKNMIDNNYLLKRTVTRIIPPKVYGLETSTFVKNINLQPGDYVLYNPMIPIQMKNQPKHLTAPHYGLKVMFFDPEKRNFNLLDHHQRMISCMSKFVVNDERVFGHTYFIKRRGTHSLIEGKYTPTFMSFLLPSKCEEYPHLNDIKKIAYHQ
jgi:hypothetical protein